MKIKKWFASFFAKTFKTEKNIKSCFSEIDDCDFVYCEVSTPQFLGSKDNFRMHTQQGRYCKKTMEFSPFEYENGNHGIQFHSQEDFLKALVRILKDNRYA